MNQMREATRVIAMCWILGGLAGGSALAERGRSDSEAATECCFENSRYAGVCVVQPAEEETCANILDYLNNPSSSGRSYCGFTEIRGGWKEIACQQETASWSSAVSRRIPDRVGAGPLDETPSDRTHEEAYAECWN